MGLERSPRSILFVCKGNTCRGPMAQALAKRRWPDCIVESVGTSVKDSRAAVAAMVVMENHFGHQIHNHKPKSIRDVAINDYEYVVILDEKEADGFAEKYEVRKAHILHAFVDDPYGDQLETYLDCAHKIDRALGRLFDSEYSG